MFFTSWMHNSYYERHKYVGTYSAVLAMYFWCDKFVVSARLREWRVKIVNLDIVRKSSTKHIFSTKIEQEIENSPLGLLDLLKNQNPAQNPG